MAYRQLGRDGPAGGAVRAVLCVRPLSLLPSLVLALSLSPRADARTARSPPDSRKPPAFTVTFSTPSTAFSGLRISALKLVGEPYSVYKGVKSGARGVVEVRTG